jgi:hypothetical protein
MTGTDWFISIGCLFVTVALDLELAQDHLSKDPDEYFAQVGRDFVALLEEME